MIQSYPHLFSGSKYSDCLFALFEGHFDDNEATTKDATNGGGKMKKSKKRFR